MYTGRGKPNMGVSSFKLFFLISILLHHSAKSIDFRVEDFDTHRVVFPFEKNVRMTCRASAETENPQIQITHQGVDVSSRQDEYTINRSEYLLQISIPRVNDTHNGTYDCSVSGQGGLTEEASLSLNVQEGGGAFCFHDAESLDFTEGDTLRVLCFFPWFATTEEVSPYDFEWKETIGSVTRTITDLADVSIEDGVKGILVGDVGTLQLSDDRHVYKCIHPMQSISGSTECSIGPISVSPKPTDAPPPPTVRRQTLVDTGMPTSEGRVTASTEGGTGNVSVAITMPIPTTSKVTEAKVTSMQSGTVIPPAASAGTTLVSGESVDPEGISSTVILLVSAAALSAIIIFLVIVCLCCLRRRGNKGDSVKQVSDVPAETADHEMTDNPVYDGSVHGSPPPEAKFIRSSRGKDDALSEHPQDRDPFDGGYLKPKSVWVASGDGNDDVEGTGLSEERDPSEPPRTYDNFRRIIGDVEESYDGVNNNRELSTFNKKSARRGGSHVYDAPPGTAVTGDPSVTNIWEKYGTLRRSMVFSEKHEEPVLY